MAQSANLRLVTQPSPPKMVTIGEGEHGDLLRRRGGSLPRKPCPCPPKSGYVCRAGGIAASRIHLRRKEEEMFPNQPFSVCTVWTTQPRKSLGTTLDLDELLLLSCGGDSPQIAEARREVNSRTANEGRCGVRTGMGSNGVTVTKFVQFLMTLELYLELSYILS